MRGCRFAVNWSEKLKKPLERKLGELEARKALGKVLRELESATWSVSPGFSAESVREDRDRG